MTYQNWMKRERRRIIMDHLIVVGAAILAGAALFAFLSIGLALDAIIPL